MIDRSTVQRIHSELKRASDYRFFFEQIQSPDWVTPLAEEGLFADPPGVSAAGSNNRYMPWPASAYLARIARAAPSEVVEIIRDMPETDNPLVHADLVRALKAVPIGLSVPLLGRVAGWIVGGDSWVLSRPVSDLVAVLMSGGATAEAIDLALVHLEIPRDEESVEVFVEKESRGQNWELEQGLKSLLEIVSDEGVVSLLGRLSDGLALVLDAEYSSSTERVWADSSSVWHSAIEEHEQSRHYDRKCWIVDAIRDLSVMAGNIDPSVLVDLVEDFEGRRWAVFVRMALYLCGEFPEVLSDTARNLLVDSDLFDEAHLRHEYYRLTQDILGRSGSEHAREEYLALVNAGPPAWLQERFDADGQGVERGELWTRDRLHPIRDYLEGTWINLYARLIADHGEPDHPDFFFYMTPVRSLGSESPLSADELRDMSTEDLIRFVCGWIPTGEFGAPSIEGLGRTLTGAVAQAPERFASEAEMFHLSEPTYVRSIVDGLNTAVEEGRTLRWDSVLNLCRWILEQSDDGFDRGGRSLDPDWSWARHSVARLLGSGMDSTDSSIPTTSADQLWSIIRALSEDPQPSPEYEEGYGGSDMDPGSLSLNTIRGYGFHDAVRFLRWLEENPHDHRTQHVGELLDLFDAHLDIGTDPSLAVRSVFGWGFGELLQASRDWTEERIDAIFPDDETMDAYRRAAFDSFLMRWRASRQMFELLGRKYAQAVDRLPTLVAEPAGHVRGDSAQRLASHLLSYYWWGYLDLEEGGLWSRFMKNANDQLRAYVVHETGRILEQSDDMPPEIVERSMLLWESRLDDAAESERSVEAEMNAFVWWFRAPQFDTEWLLDQFLRAAEYVTWIDSPYSVTDRLVDGASDHPLLTLRVLKVLIEKDEWGHIAVTQSPAVHDILAVIMSLGDDAEREARTLIDWLAARGLSEFRDLASGRAEPPASG